MRLLVCCCIDLNLLCFQIENNLISDRLEMIVSKESYIIKTKESYIFVFSFINSSLYLLHLHFIRVHPSESSFITLHHLILHSYIQTQRYKHIYQ